MTPKIFPPKKDLQFPPPSVVSSCLFQAGRDPSNQNKTGNRDHVPSQEEIEAKLEEMETGRKIESDQDPGGAPNNEVKQEVEEQVWH